MSNKSSIIMESLLMCSFSTSLLNANNGKIESLTFDGRSDFLVGESFAGIALKAEFSKSHRTELANKGVRRNISFIIVDLVRRCEIASKKVKVYIPWKAPERTVCVSFNLVELPLERAHTFKVIVRDEAAGICLGESVFHLFGTNRLSRPDAWYNVVGAGVRYDWRKGVCRSVHARYGDELNVRFNLRHNFGDNAPAVMPEVETRLYFPDGRPVLTRFAEPRCIDFYANSYFTELSFLNNAEVCGVFYAELRCMGYPVAGFVFRTDGREIAGEWFARDAECLSEYSQDAAVERFEKSVPDWQLPSNDDDLEERLNNFISSVQ